MVIQNNNVMKKILLLVISVFSLVSCKAQNTEEVNKRKEFVGRYISKQSNKNLEINSDGNYILYNPKSNGHYEIKKCEYASKGKWSKISNDVIEITSENYTTKQKGFEYELKKEKKFSNDSLYIEIKLPTNFTDIKGEEAINFNFVFNYDNNKSYLTKMKYVILPKNKYLWDKSNPTNHLICYFDANASGIELYQSRIMFEIFEDYINTEKYNYLTFTLPNFDSCFFEFEPYNQELIYINNSNQLVWKGEVWEKLN